MEATTKYKVFVCTTNTWVNKWQDSKLLFQITIIKSSLQIQPSPFERHRLSSPTGDDCICRLPSIMIWRTTIPGEKSICWEFETKIAQKHLWGSFFLFFFLGGGGGGGEGVALASCLKRTLKAQEMLSRFLIIISRGACPQAPLDFCAMAQFKICQPPVTRSWIHPSVLTLFFPYMGYTRMCSSTGYGFCLQNKVWLLEQGLQISISVWKRVYFLPFWLTFSCLGPAAYLLNKLFPIQQ